MTYESCTKDRAQNWQEGKNRLSHHTREWIASRTGKFVTSALLSSSVLDPLYNCLMRVVQQNKVLKTQPSP